MKIIKGFKAMNSDMTCRGFKFKVGKTYKTDNVEMCSKGFHFCENVFDVYDYYDKSPNTVVCEIEAHGQVLTEENKSVTDIIKIVKKLTDKELLEIWMNKNNSGNRNSGNRNSGNRNIGNRNSGNWNSGDRNSGDWNSGDWNSGYGNSGNRNSGYGNSGNRNSGDWNSGYGNSGNRNSGDWNSGYGNSGNRNSGYGNSGDWNSGCFNTTSSIFMFNKPTNFVYTQEFENRIRRINVKPILIWISELSMTDVEKTENPSYKTTGGYLKKTNRMDWKHLTKDDKKFIMNLPNYDDKVFKEITGISLKKTK